MIGKLLLRLGLPEAYLKSVTLTAKAIMLIAALWYARQSGYDACKAKWDAENYQELVAADRQRSGWQQATDRIDQAAAIQLQEYREANEDLEKRLGNELSKSPAYTDCIVPADGVRLYNEAVSAQQR